MQSALAPASPQAERIGDLTLFLTVAGGVVYLVVVAMFVAALLRRGHALRDATPQAHPGGDRETRLGRAVTLAAVLTVLVLLVTLVASVVTHRALASGRTSEALQVDVVGHQWWWEIVYLDPTIGEQVTTANELHLPAGRPVRFRLTSADVIHSLWIPPLHGKKDLIPGEVSLHWVEPQRPGRYRGQCAEFCGRQHAYMGLDAVVEPPARFAAWLEAQRRPAAAPSSELARRGLAVFLSEACALCHSVQGTPAYGEVGPDLTHLASRERLAASAVPNTRGRLAAWILDPHTTKPGVHMPPTTLAGEDLQALLAYLEGLR